MNEQQVELTNYFHALYDMAGNTKEWCHDWFVCNLGTVAETDPVGSSTGTERVCRGGAYLSTDERMLRCAARDSYFPEMDNAHCGFRMARTHPDLAGVDVPPAGSSGRLFGLGSPIPIGAATQITFTIPEAATPRPVRLAIYDVSGRLIRRRSITKRPGPIARSLGSRSAKARAHDPQAVFPSPLSLANYSCFRPPRPPPP